MKTHSDITGGQAFATPTHSISTPVDAHDFHATGDRQLAKTLGQQLLTGGRVDVPAQSTMGRWIEVLKSAMNASATRRWEAIIGGAVDEIKINSRTGELTFYFKHRIVSSGTALTDLIGGLQVFDALLTAAHALSPNTELRIPLFYRGGTVALSDVQSFYGEPQHLTPEQAAARAKELASNPVFRGQGTLPPTPLLEQVKKAVGDSDTFYLILGAIRAVLARPGPDLDLEQQQVEVAPYSRYWRQDQHQPVRVSLKQLIVDNEWLVPENREELFNLGLALGANTFCHSSKDGMGGLLSTDVSLSGADQATVIKVVQAWIAQQKQQHPEWSGSAGSLIECLSRSIPEPSRLRNIKNPKAFLKTLIDSPEGQALGQRLQTAIDALPTATSSEEALLSALLLDADINAGQQRNNLAGYNLRQPANWGCTPAEIVERFEKHLEGRFGAALAKVVAFQLLSVSAPEFLVRDIPTSLVYGSHAWALLSAAVSRIELSGQGSCASKTYQAIIEHNDIAPITEASQSQAQFALMRATIDWAIVQGVIQENPQDEYTADQVTRAAEAMNLQVTRMTTAVERAAAPAPTRKELALAELRRVYGSENAQFFEQKILGPGNPKNANRLTYSLVDIYMSGELYDHSWLSSSDEFTTEKVALGFAALPDIRRQFEETFKVYAEHLRTMFADVFEYQVSLLPPDDKQLLKHAKITTFTLELPTLYNAAALHDHALAHFIASGAILIRAELDGKTVHYLYSPMQGRIIKDADPSRPGLQFPDSHLYFTMPRPGSPGETESTVDIHWQLAGRPALGVTARRIYPSKSLETVVPKVPPGRVPGGTSPRLSELSTVVGAYFTRGMESLKKTAHGQTEQERHREFTAAAHNFILNLFPFYSAIQSFTQGKIGEGFINLVLDVFGFVMPAVRGGFQAVKAGAKSLQSFLAFTKGFAFVGARAANPLSNFFDLARGVFKLGKGSIKPLSNFSNASLERMRNFHAPRSGGFSPSTGVDNGNIAQGIYRKTGVTSASAPALAVQRNGKWYPFDAQTGTAYGAPLNEFTPRPGGARELAGPAVGTASDIGLSAVNTLLDTHLRHRSLPSVSSPKTEEPGLANDVPDSPVPAAQVTVDTALQSRLESAKSTITKLEEHSLELMARGSLDEHVPRQLWSNDPLELMDQMEAEICLIEDRTDTDAQLHGVFFKPYFFYGPIDQGPKGLEQRLAVIEQKTAAVKKAQATLYKLLNPEAA